MSSGECVSRSMHTMTHTVIYLNFWRLKVHDIETIYAYAELLGFKKNDCKPWDILQVAAYYSGQLQDH